MLFSDCSGSLRGFPYITEEKENKGEEVEEIFCFCKVLSAAIGGVEGYPVRVEADVSEGMPGFLMVGYLASEVREAARSGADGPAQYRLSASDEAYYCESGPGQHPKGRFQV